MAHSKLLFSDSPTAAPSAVSLRRGLAWVAAVYLLTRLVIWTGAYAGTFISFRMTFAMYHPFEYYARDMQAQLDDPSSEQSRWLATYMLDLNPLLRFDGQHYKSIVTGGYKYVTPEPGERLEQNIAFFPLYPLICRPFATLLGTNVAMVLVAHLATLVAVILLYVWIRGKVDHHAALVVAACTMCLPSSCYLALGYAECMTLLTFVIVCMCVDRRWFWAAALACGFATATRPTAVVMVPVFLLAYGLDDSTPIRRRLAMLIPLGLVAGAGIALYAAFLHHEYGSAFVYAENFRNGWVPDKDRGDWIEYLLMARVWYQFKHLAQVVISFPLGLVELVNPRTWNMPLTFFMLFVSIAGMWRVPARFRPLLLVGPLTFAQAYLASGGAAFGIVPIARYMATAVPTLVVLGIWMAREWRPLTRHMLLGAMLVMQGLWAFHLTLIEWPG